MKRCEQCRGTQFKTRADRHIQCDVYFNTSDGKEDYGNVKDVDEPNWFGECSCLRCGKTYHNYESIPDDGKIIECWESDAMRRMKRKKD